MINAPGDADVQIGKAAVLSSLTRSTTLIGFGSVGPASSLHATSQEGSIFPF